MTTQESQVPEQYSLKQREARGLRIAICYSLWNSDITFPLRDGAQRTLLGAGCTPKGIALYPVSGAFELSYAAARCLESEAYDAVIVLGCVIRGETSHYDLICESVAQGITALNLEARKPVIFGLVTTENKQQAIDRSGGRLGNKGCEAAIAALQMIDVGCEIEKNCVPLQSQL